MPSAALSSALPFVLRWEGGFVDHPTDPGGRTNKGVTQKVYNAWRTRLGTRAAGREEHHRRRSPCDLRGGLLDAAAMRSARGSARASCSSIPRSTWASGARSDCCKAQPAAASTATSAPAPAKAVTVRSGQLLVRYCDAREAFYRRLAEKKPELAVFLKGWLNRLNALRKEIGLPGFESAAPLDFGDDWIHRKIPEGG